MAGILMSRCSSDSDGRVSSFKQRYVSTISISRRSSGKQPTGYNHDLVLDSSAIATHQHCRQRSNNEKGVSRPKGVLSNLPDPRNILKLASIRDTFYQLLADGL